MARVMMRQPVSDPMSGFFMIDRGVVETIAPRLSTQGFKLLLDIVMTAKAPLRIAELPYTFNARQRGESKLDARVAIDFLGLVLSKATGDLLSTRFLYFATVGAIGLAVHFAALSFSVNAMQLSFSASQAIATAVAIASNFVLNNALTYRDQRLAGWRFITGLLSFEVICAVGALSNVGVANWIYDYDPRWWVAGLGGALMGAVWNYVVSAAFVWRAR
jgi:dolichol-phosphate mannosyltransferase